eukprot:395792_1
MFSWFQNNTQKAKEWSTDNPRKAIAITSIGIPSAILFGHYIYQKISNKLSNMPPGPYNLPFIGALPWTMLNYNKDDAFSTSIELAKQYGDIATYEIFGLKQIMISNAQLVKHVVTKYKAISSTKHVVKGQPLFTAKDGEENFSNLNGAEWSQRRKLFLSVFNKMLTTKFMNKVTGNAIKKVLFPEIVQHIKEKKPYFPKHTMKYLSFQTVFYANFNRFIDKNDEVYIKFRNAIELNLDLALTSEFVNSFVWGKPFAQKFYDARDQLSNIVEQLINQRRNELKMKGVEYIKEQTYDNNMVIINDLAEVIKDLEYDSYLDYLLKLVSEGKIKKTVAEVELLLLFSGGYQNIALSLEWCLMLLAKHQLIQNRIRQELFAVHAIDKNDFVTDKINDFDCGLSVKCPLLRAFIHEALRISSFARTSQIRITDKDVMIEWEGKQYRLPKGYWINYNIEYMLTQNEKSNWICDDKNGILGLHLQNFLDKNGKFKTHESFAFFGYGTRDCAGKAFAIKQIQINVGYIIMNYMIEFSDENKRNDPLNVEITADRKRLSLEVYPEIPLKFTNVQ